MTDVEQSLRSVGDSDGWDEVGRRWSRGRRRRKGKGDRVMGSHDKKNGGGIEGGSEGRRRGKVGFLKCFGVEEEDEVTEEDRKSVV